MRDGYAPLAFTLVDGGFSALGLTGELNMRWSTLSSQHYDLGPSCKSLPQVHSGARIWPLEVTGLDTTGSYTQVQDSYQDGYYSFSYRTELGWVEFITKLDRRFLCDQYPNLWSHGQILWDSVPALQPYKLRLHVIKTHGNGDPYRSL